MKRNFITIDETICTVSGTGEGTAVYSNRTSDLVGFVDLENVFTPLSDAIEMLMDCIEETDGFQTESLTPVYNDLGAFHGFIIKAKGE